MKISKGKVKRVPVAVLYTILLLEVWKAGAFPYGIVVLMVDRTIQRVDTRLVKISSDTIITARI